LIERINFPTVAALGHSRLDTVRDVEPDIQALEQAAATLERPDHSPP